MSIILRNTKQVFGLFLKIRGGIDEGKASDQIAYRLASELASVGVCDAHLEWPDVVPDVIAAYKYAKEKLDKYYIPTEGEKEVSCEVFAVNFVLDAIQAWVREDNATLE